MSSVRGAALISLFAGLVACQAPPPPAAAPQSVEAPPAVVAKVPADVEPAAPAEVKPAPKATVDVFDPGKPPAGYSRCQFGECRTEDGRVLTYKQVMEEIGAKRIAGSVDTAKLPPAPEDVAAPPKGAEKTASGLVTRVLSPGTGSARPGPASTVQVHYSGWTTDGVAFDSTVARGRPAAFPLNRVIRGWQEALQLMVPGEKRRIWVPQALAYRGKAGGPSGMLVFDLELLKILKP